jgi:CBS domain-containing protein
MKVREIMTRNVITVTEDTPVLEVARLLSERRISAVPVCNQDGAVVGLVSEFDLLAREGKTAREVMSPGIISVTEDTDVEEARFLLIERRIRRVPVMSGQKLIGIVSRSDIVRELTLHWICEACGEMTRAKAPPERCWKCGAVDHFRHERQHPGM